MIFIVVRDDFVSATTVHPSLPLLASLAPSSSGQVLAFCSDTGLVLAVFAGHALSVNCMLWIPSQVRRIHMLQRVCTPFRGSYYFF